MGNKTTYNKTILYKIERTQNSIKDTIHDLKRMKKEVLEDGCLENIEDLESKLNKQLKKFDKYKVQVAKITKGIVNSNGDVSYNKDVVFESIEELKFSNSVANYPVDTTVTGLPNTYKANVRVNSLKSLELKKGSVIYIGSKFRGQMHKNFTPIYVGTKHCLRLKRTIEFDSEDKLLSFILGRDITNKDKIKILINNMTLDEYNAKGKLL